MPIVFGLNQATHPFAARTVRRSLPHLVAQLVAGVAAGIAALGFAAAATASATAKETRASFTVNASVAAIARIVQQTTPQHLEISPADLQHGYVDVAETLGLVVQSNSTQGFSLEIVTVAPILTGIEIDGLEANARLGAEGGVVVQRWQGPQTRRLALHLRFGLLAGLTPGRYPWPIRVFVRPLDSR